MAPPPPTGDLRFDAAIAAVVEYHLSRSGLPEPPWLREPSRTLVEPWTPDPYAGPELAAEVPEPFRRHGVLLAERELESIKLVTLDRNDILGALDELVEVLVGMEARAHIRIVGGAPLPWAPPGKRPPPTWTPSTAPFPRSTPPPGTSPGAELARSLGVSQPTVRRALDALTDALVVRQLQPWHANVGKRQIRSPKVYVRDTGLLHSLLRIADRHDLLGHPTFGASWEGFVVEQLLATDGVEDPYFWGTHQGAELDLLVRVAGRPVGVEIKRTETPAVTPSMRHALADLGLAHLVVIHAGRHRFPLADQITAVPVTDVLTHGLPDPAAGGP